VASKWVRPPLSLAGLGGFLAELMLKMYLKKGDANENWLQVS